MVVERFFHFEEGVGVGGFVAHQQAEVFLLGVGPLGGVGLFGEEFIFKAGVVGFGALEEPVGLNEFFDEFAFGVGFGVVVLAPELLQGFVVLGIVSGDEQDVGGAAAVFQGVLGGIVVGH